MIWRTLGTTLKWMAWVAGTIALGVLALWRAARLARTWGVLTGDSARCPRGHRNSMVGVWECRSCGSKFDGWAFQPCPICKATAHFVACQRCGLSIKSPLSL